MGASQPMLSRSLNSVLVCALLENQESAGAALSGEVKETWAVIASRQGSAQSTLASASGIQLI